MNPIDAEIESLRPAYKKAYKLFDSRHYKSATHYPDLEDQSIIENFHELNDQLGFLRRQKHVAELILSGFKLRGDFVHGS
jgi:hypothetical protein